MTFEGWSKEDLERYRANLIHQKEEKEEQILRIDESIKVVDEHLNKTLPLLKGAFDMGTYRLWRVSWPYCSEIILVGGPRADVEALVKAMEEKRNYTYDAEIVEVTSAIREA